MEGGQGVKQHRRIMVGAWDVWELAPTVERGALAVAALHHHPRRPLPWARICSTGSGGVVRNVLRDTGIPTTLIRVVVARRRQWQSGLGTCRQTMGEEMTRDTESRGRGASNIDW